MIRQVDIVVVGASIVGLSFANAIARSGFNVVVVDAGKQVHFPKGDAAARVSALSLASQRGFENLNVWQHLDQERITAYRHMHVWEKDSFAEIKFDAPSDTATSLGCIVENNNIVAALHKALLSHDNVDILFETKIAQLQFAYPNHALQLSNGHTLITRMVIGADGGNSMVRRQAGFPLTFNSYEQTAIVATVETTEPHDFGARQAFTATGPLAFLPLWHQQQCSIVWSQDNDTAGSLLDLTNEEFEKALAVAFDLRLGKVSLVSERYYFPLKMQYARQWVSDGIALIGDAAHTIHPLAGQGANLGIMDALALAETLSQQDKDSGFANQSSLRQFERWRKAEATKMIATMEGFKQLFATDHPVKKLVRGLGMSAVNHLPLLKQDIIEQAMGTSGHLPALAQR